MPVLGALSLDVATAAFTPRCSFHAESCEGRCDEGFNSLQKCQCDTLCVYYQSCCSDYSTVCKTKGTGLAAPPCSCHWPRGSQGSQQRPRPPALAPLCTPPCPQGDGRAGIWHWGAAVLGFFGTQLGATDSARPHGAGSTQTRRGDTRGSLGLTRPLPQ